MLQKITESQTCSEATILVVDDDEHLRILIKRNLCRAGFHVEGVSNGQEAIAHVCKEEPALLLLDYKLTDMSGSELIDSLHKKNLTIPFILMTGHGSERIAVEMMKLGAFDYLIKDHNFLDLLPKVVERAVNRYALEKKLAQAEQALQQERDNLANILGAMEDGAAIIDQDNNIIFLNPALRNEFGPLDERKCFDYFSCRTSPCPTCENKEIFKGKISRREWHSKQNQKTYELVDSPIKVPDNSHAKLVILRDITDRKQAEDELRRTEEALRRSEATLLEAQRIARFGSWMWDPEAEVFTWSDEVFRIFGLEPTTSPVSYEEFLDGVHREDRSYVKKKMDDAIQKQKPYDIEHQIMLPDGSVRIGHQQAEFVRDKEGKTQTIIGTIQDITERKQAEEDKANLEHMLRQAHKMEAIGSLAGGIAHDFNNILTPILGYGDMLKKSLEPDGTAATDLEQILLAANRAKDLVGQILTFSRQGEQDLRPLRIQLVIKEALKLLRASIPTTIQISKNINPECSSVMADPTYVHQIIMNLGTNAYHAMREKGGTLHVSLQPVELGAGELGSKMVTPGPFLKLEISDTGVGMEPAVLERIFDPYFTTKKTGDGTGLGLAVVHGIMKSIGGHIHAESTPGQGTTFYAYFPAIATEQVPAKSKQTEPIPRGRERVMAVDDEEVVAGMEKKMLQGLGYSVTTFTDSEEALAAFTSDPEGFDLILTDMTMPKMTGVELIKGMQAIRPDIPIILCTGFSELVDEKEAKRMGVKRFILKPIIMTNIATAIREVLDQE